MSKMIFQNIGLILGGASVATAIAIPVIITETNKNKNLIKKQNPSENNFANELDALTKKFSEYSKKGDLDTIKSSIEDIKAKINGEVKSKDDFQISTISKIMDDIKVDLISDMISAGYDVDIIDKDTVLTARDSASAKISIRGLFQYNNFRLEPDRTVFLKFAKGDEVNYIAFDYGQLVIKLDNPRGIEEKGLGSTGFSNYWTAPNEILHHTLKPDGKLGIGKIIDDFKKSRTGILGSAETNFINKIYS